MIQRPTNEVDILFVVADFMRQWLPMAVAQEVPFFMNELQELPRGLPSLHLGVVSASLGAGAFSTVAGCADGTEGDAEGRLQYPSWCTGLLGPDRFIRASADGSANNFTGAAAAVASCMMQSGGRGCAFGQPLAAAHRALEKAAAADDRDNGGFLRPDANLAVIVVSNVDDCSVPSDSTLFDPAVNSLDDPSGLGVLSSYRCAEFGHLCEGQAPPHRAGDVPLLLKGCGPAEEEGRLTPVRTFVDSLRALKPGRPDRIVVAATTAPTTPYTVEIARLGSMDHQPTLGFSCVGGAQGTSWGTPSVRIAHWVDAFGGRGVVGSVCAERFLPFLSQVSDAIKQQVHGGGCIARPAKEPLATDPEATTVVDLLGCSAFETGAGGARHLPRCDAPRSDLPCWEVDPTGREGCDHLARVCYGPTCDAMEQPATSTVSIYCGDPP